jgi:hypothetical protein
LSVANVLQITLLFAWLAAQWAMAQATGAIRGKVTDVSGAAILGAVVSVTAENGNQRTTVTDGEGSFQISSLPPGDYRVKISANGLSDWTAEHVPASVNAEGHLVLAVMDVAPTVTSVTVGVPPEELATQQLKQEEKQRAFGVFPNYFVTYEQNPAPLSAKQKLHLGVKTLLDPTTFALAGVSAGIQQAQNSYHQYGQGAEGFAKRYGAQYATGVAGLLMGGVLMDSLVRQDPRYFYSGRGTRGQRFRYALGTAFLGKGDNGKWQPPYSDLAGMVVSAELSQTYLPGSRTQYTLLGRSLMFRFAGRVALNLSEEFFFKKVTTNVPPDQSVSNRPVLREGTPVPLIAVDGLEAGGITTGKTVSFVLARDLTVDGKVVAKTGDVASGQVGQVSTARTAGEASNVGLEQVRLRAGNVDVPLRSSQVRGAVNSMQYKELPGSGKIEVTLYVAQNVLFPEDQ